MHKGRRERGVCASRHQRGATSARRIGLQPWAGGAAALGTWGCSLGHGGLQPASSWRTSARYWPGRAELSRRTLPCTLPCTLPPSPSPSPPREGCGLRRHVCVAAGAPSVGCGSRRTVPPWFGLALRGRISVGGQG